jgi:hypothetical protein
MAMQHRDWVAILDRRVHIFDVMGYITSLDIPLQGGGGYYVTTGAELEKRAARDPAILVLELVLRQDLHPLPHPNPEPPALQARYYVSPTSMTEEAYRRVHVFYNGQRLTEIDVQIFS